MTGTAVPSKRITDLDPAGSLAGDECAAALPFLAGGNIAVSQP
jgi:hypothetical protein